MFTNFLEAEKKKKNNLKETVNITVLNHYSAILNFELPFSPSSFAFGKFLRSSRWSASFESVSLDEQMTLFFENTEYV